jgi:hypothetical protein
VAKSNPTVELFWDDVWNDVTSDALVAGRITVKRGQGNEAAQAQPGGADFALKNLDGTYSWRNPGSATFGRLRRGTLCRIYEGRPPVGASNFSLSTTTTHTAPSLTSPTDEGLLVCGWGTPQPASGAPNDYTLPGGMTGLVEQHDSFSTFRAAYQAISATGATGVRSATFSSAQTYAAASVLLNGDSLTVQQTTSAEGVLTTGAGTLPGWWAVVHCFYGWDDNGGDEQVPDFPFDDDGGGWIPLADTGVQPAADVHAEFIQLKAWAKQVKLGGAFDIRLHAPGDDTLVSRLGSLLVVSGVDTYLPKTHTRVVALPAVRDVSGRIKSVPVQTADALRQAARSKAPIRSAIYRTVMAAEFDVNRVAYWPCEEPTGGTQFASALPGGAPLDFAPGAMTLAAHSGFYGSRPLPLITAGNQAGVDSARGPIPPYTGGFFYRGLFAMPAAGLPDGGQIVAFQCNGGEVEEVELEYGTAGTGSMRLRLFDTDGTLLDETGVVDFAIDGAQFLTSVELVQDGADVDWLMFVRKVSLEGVVEVGTFVSGTFTGVVLGTAHEIHIGGTNADDLVFGHQMIGSSQRFVFNIAQPLGGWANERVSDRIRRLARENGLLCEVVGDREQDVLMGPEGSATLAGHLRECAATGGGILYGPKQFYGIGYRTLASLYSQPPGATYTFGATGEVAPPLAPVPDDALAVNMVTVSRPAGSSYTTSKLTGALSVAELGEQDADYPVNAPDNHLPEHGDWRLHLGTTPGDRFPDLSLDMDALAGAGKAALILATDLLDVGSRVVLDGMDSADEMAPDNVDVLALGFTEVIGSHRRQVSLNAVPEQPYHVAEVEHDDYAYLGPDPAWGFTTSASFTSGTSTSMGVAFSGNQPGFLGADVPFDVLVAGVRLHVTATSGASSPNVLTVDQAPVNGVVKVIPAGTQVELFHPAYIGL